MSKLEKLLCEKLKEEGISFKTQPKLIPGRQFKTDIFIPPHIVIEVEGGVWTGGRHTRGSGFVKDIEKYNLYTLNGYKLLRFSSSELTKKNLPKTISTIKQLIEQTMYLPAQELNTRYELNIQRTTGKKSRGK